MKQYTSKEISEQIGIADNLVEEWSDTFDVPHQKVGNRYIFPETSLHILMYIKQLKDEADGLNTIRRKIDRLPPELELDEPSQEEPTWEAPHNIAEIVEAVKPPGSEHTDLDRKIQELLERFQAELKHTLHHAVIDGLDKHQQMAEKYATATYLIGKQEERIKALENQVKELEKKYDQPAKKQPSFWQKLMGESNML